MAAKVVSASSKWERDTRTHDQVVAHGERRSLVRAKVVEVVGLAGERGVDMVDDRLGDSRRVWIRQSLVSVRLFKLARCTRKGSDG